MVIEPRVSPLGARYQGLGRDYQAGLPDNALPPWQKPGGNIMSLLMKIGFRCAMWMLTFCAVLISPVILIYGMPVLVGVVADVLQAGLGPLRPSLSPVQRHGNKSGWLSVG
jgi:hypothetical protein